MAVPSAAASQAASSSASTTRTTFVCDERPPLHMLALITAGGLAATLFLAVTGLPWLAPLPLLLVGRAAWDLRDMRRVVIDCDDRGFTAAIDSRGTRRAVRRCTWSDVAATHYEEVPGIYGLVGRFSVEVNGQTVVRVDARRTPRFGDLIATINAHTLQLPYTWERPGRTAGAETSSAIYVRVLRATAVEANTASSDSDV